MKTKKKKDKPRLDSPFIKNKNCIPLARRKTHNNSPPLSMPIIPINPPIEVSQEIDSFRNFNVIEEVQTLLKDTCESVARIIGDSPPPLPPDEACQSPLGSENASIYSLVAHSPQGGPSTPHSLSTDDSNCVSYPMASLWD